MRLRTRFALALLAVVVVLSATSLMGFTLYRDAVVDDESVRITVSDNGPGLPEIERRVPAEPFAETPTEHGRGLGLWLVTRLVQWTDGEIEVDVDDGTTVTVTVPRVREDRPRSRT